MSIQAVGAVLEADVGKVAAKMLLVSLANAHNTSTGLCAPSVSRLQCESGMTRSAVQRWLSWLIEQGWIEVEDRFDTNGRQTSNRYTLLFLGEGPSLGRVPVLGGSQQRGPRGPQLWGPSKETLIQTGNSAGAREAIKNTDLVPFDVAGNVKFVSACLAEWSDIDGKDHRWKAQNKSVSIPSEVVQRVRERLNAKSKRGASGNRRRAGEKAGSAPE